MLRIENREIYIWILVMVAAWVIYGLSFGAMFGGYIGINVAGPAVEEFSAQGGMQNNYETGFDEGQMEGIEKATIEKMKEVNWWLVWPMFNSLAWAIASIFLGFMKLIKYNEGLVVISSLYPLLKRNSEWSPPGDILIEIVTILIAIVVVHFVGRWMYLKKKETEKIEKLDFRN